MGISKFNAEGYRDQTAYEALTNVEKEDKKSAYRPLVYICSPYSGDVEANTEKARRYSRFVVDRGFLPLTPHLLYPQFLNDEVPTDRDLGLFFRIVLLVKCSEIWAFGCNISIGMTAEIDKANRKNLPIRYFNGQCEEVFPK